MADSCLWGFIGWAAWDLWVPKTSRTSSLMMMIALVSTLYPLHFGHTATNKFWVWTSRIDHSLCCCTGGMFTLPVPHKYERASLTVKIKPQRLKERQWLVQIASGRMDSSLGLSSAHATVHLMSVASGKVRETELYGQVTSWGQGHLPLLRHLSSRIWVRSAVSTHSEWQL